MKLFGRRERKAGNSKLETEEELMERARAEVQERHAESTRLAKRMWRDHDDVLMVAVHPDVAKAERSALEALDDRSMVWLAIVQVAVHLQGELVKGAMTARGEERSELVAKAAGVRMLLGELQMTRNAEAGTRK